MTRSPYELTTPPDLLARLHPRLRTYFGPVPSGDVGRGEGVFTVVGTPRRWLWPLLAVFARDDVMFPVWERDVPFTVENRPARVGHGASRSLRSDMTAERVGSVAVRAHRTFRFRSGHRTMVDAITAEPHGLVDHLGRRGRVSALLRAEVDADGPDAGALRLVSTRVTVRALGRAWSLPTVATPRVTLVERFDDDADVQRVSLRLSAPLVGTLYRYEGSFRYRIEPDTGGPDSTTGETMSDETTGAPRGRAVIAGAGGFVGQYLQRAFRDEGYEVVTVGRTGDAVWGNTLRIRELVDGAAIVVNMAGKSVNCRYGRRNRAEIMRSRVDTTLELAEAIRTAEHPPPLWLNASTATIYRHADDRPQDEATGELGEGFSVSVARAWEDALFSADLPHTRRVALRMAIVFGDGSALVPLLGLARAGLGGPQFDGPWFPTRARLRAGTYHHDRHTRGRQRFSWVHIEDVLEVVRFVRDHEEIDGPVNVSSPQPSDNRTVMATIRDAVGRRFGLPTWRWMLEIGSFAIRTETELVLKSRWVVPTRLLEAGYEFRHPDLRGALAGIIAERRQHRG